MCANRLLEYDNVANDQRTIIYRQRNELMASDDISDLLAEMRADVVAQLVDEYLPPQSVPEQWNLTGLEQALTTQFAQTLPVRDWLEQEDKLFEERTQAAHHRFGHAGVSGQE